MGDQKKLIRGLRKIIPRGSKKNIMRFKKKLFTWKETLSCGRGAKIASLTGSKKIIRPGSLPKNDMKNCTQFWPGAHSLVKMYETHYARTTVGSSGGRSASPPDALLTTMMVVFVLNLLLLLLLLFMVVVDIVDGAGAGAGGFGAVRGGNL